MISFFLLEKKEIKLMPATCHIDLKEISSGLEIPLCETPLTMFCFLC